MKIRKLNIINFGVFTDFTIDFTFENAAQNLIVIAGVNGSGKTTIFEYIDNFFKRNDKFTHGSILVQDKDKILNYRKDVSEPVYQHEDQLPGNQLAEKIFYFKANEERISNADEIIVEYIEKLIFEDQLSPSDAYNATNNILNDIFSGFDLQLSFHGLDRKKQVSFINESGKVLKTSMLSSGEKELLTKVFSLYLSNAKDCIILIDEPENSLHPLWQNRIVPVYQKFADNNNNQIILATHSPHIVGSVKNEQIRVLIREKGKIDVISSFSGSYGWPIEKILLEIFRTNELRTVEIEEKINQLNRLVTNNEYNSDEAKMLLKYLEDTLGYDDNDLVVIRLEIAKRIRRNDKN